MKEEAKPSERSVKFNSNYCCMYIWQKKLVSFENFNPSGDLVKTFKVFLKKIESVRYVTDAHYLSYAMHRKRRHTNIDSCDARLSAQNWANGTATGTVIFSQRTPADPCARVHPWRHSFSMRSRAEGGMAHPCSSSSVGSRCALLPNHR